MKNPNGSDIPGARELIEQIIYRSSDAGIVTLAREALAKMTRQKPVRVARSNQPKITEAMKEQVRHLLQTTDLSQADIAIEVGLPPSALGRISEIQAGLR